MVYIFPSPRTILLRTNTCFSGKLYIVEQLKINWITSRLMLFSLRDLIFSFTDGLHIWTSTNCREKLGILEKRFVWHNPSFFFKYYSMIFWIVDDTYIS